MKGRPLTVRLVAWLLRRGVHATVLLDALGKSHSHRDGAWRWQVLVDAETRNQQRQQRKAIAP